ncbi:MAG: hypothetical protein ABSE68_01515 [Minisyncoccia bacterium]
MLWFIIEIVIMVSLAGIIYLLARALPRVSDEVAYSFAERSRVMSYVEKLDDILKAFLEKFLRQAMVWILKIGNFVSGKLNKFKKEAPKENKLPVIEEKKESD